MRVLSQSFVAVCAVVLAASVPVVGTEGMDAVGIDIRLQVDPSLKSRRLVPHLKREAQAIWEPYGVRLEWVDFDLPDVSTHALSLDASVERDAGERDRSRGTFVLGHSPIVPIPAAWQPVRVSFDATERVLSSSQRSASRVVHDREMAVALGRVLAHEIGHVLLSAPFHHPAGLMRPNFVPDELGAPDRRPFRLTCLGVARLRNRLGALTGRAPAAPRRAPCISQ